MVVPLLEEAKELLWEPLLTPALAPFLSALHGRLVLASWLLPPTHTPLASLSSIPAGPVGRSHGAVSRY